MPAVLGLSIRVLWDSWSLEPVCGVCFVPVSCIGHKALQGENSYFHPRCSRRPQEGCDLVQGPLNFTMLWRFPPLHFLPMPAWYRGGQTGKGELLQSPGSGL